MPAYGGYLGPPVRQPDPGRQITPPPMPGPVGVGPGGRQMIGPPVMQPGGGRGLIGPPVVQPPPGIGLNPPGPRRMGGSPPKQKKGGKGRVGGSPQGTLQDFAGQVGQPGRQGSLGRFANAVQGGQPMVSAQPVGLQQYAGQAMNNPFVGGLQGYLEQAGGANPFLAQIMQMMRLKPGAGLF